MPFRENLILLPCHSLDDFPVYHTGDDAESLLASWSALWHPYLLDSTGKVPSWQRVDDPPESCRDLLMVVPTVGMRSLPSGFTRRAADEGGCLVCEGMERDAIANFAIEFLAGDQSPDLDADLVLDFYALGYCYLQIQLLTRHMRYSSNLDTVYFGNQAVAAAGDACRGDVAQAREKLQACFDVLAEERDHFYPVDAFLLDLTLIAPGTLGESLRRECELTNPSNLLLTGEVAGRLSQGNETTLETLQAAIQEGRVELVGGEYEEIRTSLLTHESLLHNLLRGLESYEAHLGARPVIYGRRRFGLSPALPELLLPLGFRGALHFTLDEGRFPEGLPIKIGWEGASGAAIDAYAKVPLDASKPETFLNLAVKMGEQMDMDHVATVCFAHWPGKHSVWYDDLRRAARYSGALGSFLSFSEFFQQAGDPGFDDRFRAEQYRSPYLKQAIERQEIDPLSRISRFWHEQAALRAATVLEFLTVAMGGTMPPRDLAEDWHHLTARCEHPSLPEASLVEDADGETESDSGVDPVSSSAVTPPLAERLQRAMTAFAERLPRDGTPHDGALLINPCSFAQRFGERFKQLSSLPVPERPVYAVDEVDGEQLVVSDVPPLGFTWLGAPAGKSKSRRKAVMLAEDYLLRNEYCELVVDQSTGGIRSIHEYNERQNRISQQLALRIRAAGRDEEYDHYSRMVADRIEVLTASEACGQIETSGTLRDEEDHEVASFRQRMTIWRGSRVIQVEVELDPQIELRPAPWEHYFASRFAWKEEAADLWCGVNQQRQPVTRQRIESPEYLEIESDQKRTAILPGGLPFHRKYKLHMLDSLLIVHGERARKFRFGIAIDATHPAQAAEAFLAPRCLLSEHAAAPHPTPSSCLVHVDAKNVLATFWQPFSSDEGSGFRVRLLETMGREATVRLQTFRPLQSASIMDFEGQTVRECTIEQGRAVIPMQARQFVQVEVRW